MMTMSMDFHESKSFVMEVDWQTLLERYSPALLIQVKERNILSLFIG